MKLHSIIPTVLIKGSGFFDKVDLIPLDLQKSSSFKEKLLRLFPAGRKFIDGNKALHSQIKNNLGGIEADSSLMKIFGSNRDKISDINGFTKLDTKIPTLEELPINYFDDILDSADTSTSLKDFVSHAKSHGYKNLNPSALSSYRLDQPISSEELANMFKDFSKKDNNFRTYTPEPGDAFNFDEMFTLDGLGGIRTSISETNRPGLIYHDKIWSKPLVKLGPENQAVTREWRDKTHKQKPNQPYIGSPEYRKAMEGAIYTAKNTDKARKLLLFRDVPITAATAGASAYGIDYATDKRDLNKNKQK